ncbi:MAG: hypothetical protein L0332_20890 [Chloroflexi bacterium]|nr:hypothetical protein [Chloroflexota bacterium]MCI0580430.1 hypothetical protein [Chloroflexota bacterium]MCI0643937.1 hypothetical protein [Chloroflexota bacterium]MCI0729153.1 hypothetical protein [Chloroflexota bacterium]
MHLGTGKEGQQRKAALLSLARAVEATGRQGESIGVLACELADAFAAKPEMAAGLVKQLLALAEEEG